MDRSSRRATVVFILAAVLIACTLSSTPTRVPLATESALSASAPTRLPFEGMWVSEGDAPEILVFTKDSMYKVEADQSNPDQPYSREQFAKIRSYDLENNHISLRMQWIRVAGAMSGFGHPNFNITYRIDGDTLQIGMGWEEEFATEMAPRVYQRK